MHKSIVGRAIRGIGVPLVCLAAGCYSYVPVESPPPVGSDVSVNLTAEEALRQSEITGDLTRSYDGRLMGASDDSVSLSVVAFHVAAEITGSRALRQTIIIPRSQIEELSYRQLSATRTGMLGLAVAGLITAAVNQVVEAGGIPDPDGDGGVTTGGLVPIVIRVPVGR